MPDPIDSYTRTGAGALAAKIEAYWHARGYATVKVERYELVGYEGLWGVRSNLVAGLPPGTASRVVYGTVKRGDIIPDPHNPDDRMIIL